MAIWLSTHTDIDWTSKSDTSLMTRPKWLSSGVIIIVDLGSNFTAWPHGGLDEADILQQTSFLPPTVSLLMTTLQHKMYAVIECFLLMFGITRDLQRSSKCLTRKWNWLSQEEYLNCTNFATSLNLLAFTTSL